MAKNVLGWKSACRFLLVFSLAAGPLAASAPQLAAEQKKAAIENINALLADNYVFPETASKMAEHLSRRLAEGAYDAISAGPELAELFTRDLQSISRDKHLRVRFDPEGAARMRQRRGDGPDPEQRQRMLDDARRRNFGFEKVEILDGNIGYLKLNGFAGMPEAGEAAVAAMNFLSNVDALIIDLRSNGGGSPNMIQILSSYLFDSPQHLNSFYWRPSDRTTQTWTLPYVPGRRLTDVPVYLLTSNRTFSAAEEFTYNLKNMERATIIGETTGGGAHPGGPMPADDRFVVWVPQGRAINPVTQTNWEGTGIEPHIPVEAPKALDRARIEAMSRLSAETDDKDRRQSYAWALEGLKAAESPTQVAEEVLRSYQGNYGARHIRFRDGALYYQRDGGPLLRMIPMRDDLFRFEEIGDFRLEILKEDGRAAALLGHYADGRSDRSDRDD